MADINNDNGYENAAAQDWSQNAYMNTDYEQWAPSPQGEQSSYDADEGLAFPLHVPPHLPPRPKRRSMSSEGFVDAQSPSKANKADRDSSQGP